MNITAQLLAALVLVESSGNDKAVNVKEQAYGCLGTRQCVIDDVNGRYGTHFRLEDMLDREYSVRVFKLYVQMWATKERIGREPTTEDMARIWNGGPNGWRRTTTVAYWNKVQGYMEGVKA